MFIEPCGRSLFSFYSAAHVSNSDLDFHAFTSSDKFQNILKYANLDAAAE